jgi:tetratricopeptide (TPR) repeat protein
MPQAAIATLKSALRLGDWMPLLKGQLYAQLGFLEHQAGNRSGAIGYLTQAGRRAGDAKLLLASFYVHDGKKAEALTLLADSLPFNRKHVLLHNTYAWLLSRDGRRADAIAVLNRLLAKEKDTASADNLLRLQNDQRMNMAPFGMVWYALGFERPPAHMGTLRTAPKGFREAPKRRR